MAKIVYTIPVAELIGSIGGTTYQSNNSGFIARNKPTYRQHKTNRQQTQLNQFTYLSQLYRNLSPSNKTSWQAFATANNHTTLWNNNRTIDGLKWFISINSYRLSLSLSILNAPPAYTLPSAIPTITTTITATDIEISSASPFGTGSESLLIFATSPLPDNTNTPRKSIRYLQAIAANTASPVNLTSIWENTFGFQVGPDLFTPDNQIIVAVSKVLNSNCVALPFTFSRS